MWRLPLLYRLNCAPMICYHPHQMSLPNNPRSGLSSGGPDCVLRGEYMQLQYKRITRHIIRCFLGEPAKVTIGPIQGETTIRWDCSEFNMSAVIASRATIRAGDEGAIIEWREDGPKKISGDLEIEISQNAE